ncbi:MAG: HPr family phosphocarrier protein, partial [Planctomycetota bacterium]
AMGFRKAYRRSKSFKMERDVSAQMTDQTSKTLEREIEVVNRMGIHARPATKIVELTNTFKAHITIIKDGEEVDGKSIFGVMTLAANQGTVLKVRVEGEDAEALLKALENLFLTGFDEMESEENSSQETQG